MTKQKSIQDTREKLYQLIWNNPMTILAAEYGISDSWYQATTDIASYQPEELFGTKLRALLQRRKNRDLFDLNEG